MVKLSTSVKLLSVSDFKSYIFLSFFTCFSLLTWSQDFQSIKNWELVNYAKSAELAKDWYTAADALEELDYRGQLNSKEKKGLANIYRQARDYQNALDLYQKLLKKLPNDPEVHFYYALMAKQLGMFGTAQEYFYRFKRKYKDDGSAKKFLERIDFEIEGCELAELPKYKNQDVDVKRLPFDINLPHNESAPVIIDTTEIWYASVQTQDYVFQYEDDIPLKSFHQATKTDTIWSVNNSYYPVFDSIFELDNGTLSPDGKKYYFTKCFQDGKKRHCDIWLTAKDSTGVFKTPIKLPSNINRIDAYQTQPFVYYKPNGTEVLYFVSDREGGMGGLDIWFTERKGANFGKIINCGKKINTRGDEITPFYDVNNATLYFSSNSHPGMGGQDVFKASGQGKSWEDPINMGRPLNSGSDDQYFTLIQDTIEYGFFTSNRPGGRSLKGETCCDDIFEYYTKRVIPDLEIEGEVDFVDVMGEYAPSETDKAAVAKLLLHVGNDRVLIEEQPLEDNKYAFTLKPDKEYDIIVEQEGYITSSTTISTMGKKQLGKAPNIQMIKLGKEPIVIKNIYYPFDKAYLTAAAKENIDTTIYEILVNNPSIIIELSSHTDWFGTDLYNEDLSQRRAESVVNYLIQKGISSERLTAKGYGEYKPLVPNANPDGTDNPDNRAKNRRTEFRVIGTLPQYNAIIYEE